MTPPRRRLDARVRRAGRLAGRLQTAYERGELSLAEVWILWEAGGLGHHVAPPLAHVAGCPAGPCTCRPEGLLPLVLHATRCPARLCLCLELRGEARTVLRSELRRHQADGGT